MMQDGSRQGFFMQKMSKIPLTSNFNRPRGQRSEGEVGEQ